MPLLAFFLFVLISLHCSPQVASTGPSFSQTVLSQGSSLLVEKNDHMVSPNHVFTAGFHQVGQNAYCFAIWYSEPTVDDKHEVIWMANRDEPVNGKRSRFSLWRTGNLVLTDVDRVSWSTNTKSDLPLQLQLLDSGNLVLTHLDNNNDRSYIWQSFSFPTDTILPNQPFTKDTVLISSRSSTNFSSGFYKLYFDNDNVIRLLYDNGEVTSVYWPSPWLVSWAAGRSTYNNSRLASLDSKGQFKSSDDFTFLATDYEKTLQRRLKLDVDGNIRVYTLNERRWIVSWQAISMTCTIHGICGPNSLCSYDTKWGRRCDCMHGYKVKNSSDLSFGCEPTFDFSGDEEGYEFIELRQTEFYGFDSIYRSNSTFQGCKNLCLNRSDCKAFQFNFDKGTGLFTCYLKTLLFNGHQGDTRFNTYLKLLKENVLSSTPKVTNKSELDNSTSMVELQRAYGKKGEHGSLKFMLWFSTILGVIQALCFLFFYFITKKSSSTPIQSYLAIATGFKRFTYDEIRKASGNFKEEIGRGGGGIVYKGMLSDNRLVAIKELHEAIQGEEEFLAEMRTIGRINHRNLIETYGYCAEGKHRILVYEYMENGSLARNLGANKLGWKKKYEIAVGVAKGLAYLHEECLEWVLHCDVKPHNILLDADYNPKVADFGLSKLFHQDLTGSSTFSKIRGTRGYMAPEWVFNLPITSKVDVYSYGMVLLEMITGRSPTCNQVGDDIERLEQKRLVNWVREKVIEATESLTKTEIMEILDTVMNDENAQGEMKNVLKVALQCVMEDKDARPSMSEVVNMLLHNEIEIDDID